MTFAPKLISQDYAQDEEVKIRLTCFVNIELMTSPS
jgi:hypothetical protein